MRKLTGLAFALSLSLGTASCVMAGPPADRGDTPGLGWGPGGNHSVVGAPGPVAGIGLPILAVAGGFIWIRSRKRRQDRLKE